MDVIPAEIRREPPGQVLGGVFRPKATFLSHFSKRVA